YGRDRSERWAPRTLDVDLIIVGTTVADEPDLKLPHPFAHDRGFVLVPWAEVDPRGEIPGWGNVVERAKEVDLSGVVRRTDLPVEGGDDAGCGATLRTAGPTPRRPSPTAPSR